MDRIMPIELDRVRLKRRLRGYDLEEVDELVKVCARTIESLQIENVSLREENARQKSELNRVAAQEGVLRDTLTMAQKAADETRVCCSKARRSHY